ncbi:20S proteasome subunit alpha 1 [Nematocida sp. LUAm1]|nr:20S proteasome subunit alpha 1 [Nematocida sp. LUAm2]KAI5178531.1 20S proteasome subunit alpha 1 [Nematocida sp. LUAm1]
MSEERINNAFSEEGTLYQVEYALEATKKGMSCVVLYGKDGIVMGASKRVPEKLMDPEYISSFFEIIPGLVGVISGYAMDVQDMKINTKKYALELLYDLGRTPTPDILCRRIADTLQVATQKSHRRLTAVSVCIVGYDKETPLIYYTDTSGVLFPCKATAFGEGGPLMQKDLEKTYKEKMGEEELLECALHGLSGALGNDYAANLIEVAVLKKNTALEILHLDRIDALLAQVGEKRE